MFDIHFFNLPLSLTLSHSLTLSLSHSHSHTLSFSHSLISYRVSRRRGKRNRLPANHFSVSQTFEFWLWKDLRISSFTHKWHIWTLHALQKRRFHANHVRFGVRLRNVHSCVDWCHLEWILGRVDLRHIWKWGHPRTNASIPCTWWVNKNYPFRFSGTRINSIYWLLHVWHLWSGSLKSSHRILSTL